MTTVHLIDGTWELFRAFFGAPRETAPDGREVGAVRSLLRSFAGLVRRPDVTHVGVAFDSVIESFRNALFPGYKSGDGVDPELLAQFPLAERAAAALGIVVWPMRDFEADDALATAARVCAESAGIEQVRLCSPDKDLAQCVRGRLVVRYDRRSEAVGDEMSVIERFGVPPRVIPAWIALVGDSADGIPGVPKFGPKSASVVLGRYGSIAAIPASAADWDVAVRGAAGLAASLAEHREAAALYERLATLVTDVPIDASPASLRYGGPDRRQLAELCDELGTSLPRIG
ncbi:MAG: flap endonuclease [Planctomycetes bacterium]|nr:flap endonuclease [Planctomycetota bacterium]